MPLSKRALVDAEHRTEPCSFRLSFLANQAQVRDTLAQVRRHTDNWKLSEDASGSVEIVLAEALNNVVKHAYDGIEDGVITLDGALNGSGLSIVITDQGNPVPEAVFLSKHRCLKSTEVENLPEGGFGWGLIQELAHDLKISRIGKTTLLSLTIDTI